MLLTEQFARARDDRTVVVLEGFHALKHALRFGARIEAACTPDRPATMRLAQDLAPDLCDRLRRPRPGGRARDLREARAGTARNRRAGDRGAPADRPGGRSSRARDPAPIVLLENPSHPGNLGAVVRVAAAAGAAAVLTTGARDPWQPAALRGSAGLHFALPVAGADPLPFTDRPLLAIDPDGEPLTAGLTMDRAILAFGSERRGLAPGMLARAERRIAIPMREGVSSLNLACAVAVVLYAWRAARPERDRS